MSTESTWVPGSESTAEQVVQWAWERYGNGLVMTSSFGARAAAMLHVVLQAVPKISVVFLDTGYLFPETYVFAEEMRERFGLKLEVYSSNITAARQEAIFGRLWEQGREGLARYHQLNKIEPMGRAFRELGATAWISGVRAVQTSFRAGLRRVEPGPSVVRIYPMLTWSTEEVDAYMERHNLPYHPLYSRGYTSIGDRHLTKPVTDGQDERGGRLLGNCGECGIHLKDEDA